VGSQGFWVLDGGGTRTEDALRSTVLAMSNAIVHRAGRLRRMGRAMPVAAIARHLGTEHTELHVTPKTAWT
jgi:hypothetical protein